MKAKGLYLTWIVVNDIKKAVKFYTEILGLKLESFDEQFGWAELSGHEGGARLGLAQQSPHEPIKAGQNGVFTISVDDVEKAKAELISKGVKAIGDIIHIPDIVKLQTMVDPDGNHLQIVKTYDH